MSPTAINNAISAQKAAAKANTGTIRRPNSRSRTRRGMPMANGRALFPPACPRGLRRQLLAFLGAQAVHAGATALQAPTAPQSDRQWIFARIGLGDLLDVIHDGAGELVHVTGLPTAARTLWHGGIMPRDDDGCERDLGAAAVKLSHYPAARLVARDAIAYRAPPYTVDDVAKFGVSWRRFRCR